MTRQQIFEAILSSIATHAPDLAQEKRVAIATDAALKLAAMVPPSFDRGLRR